MKKFLLLLSVCTFVAGQVKADDMDLLSDDLLLGGSAEISATKTSDNVGENETKTKDEHNGSFFGFIIKPISDFFSSDAKITDVAEGEKESPLDRIIRKADEGSLEEQMNLGYMYLYGANGVTANAELSFKYYEMAAKQNDPIAVNNLGSLYFSGIGTAKNYDKALALFSQASDLGNDNASLNLAFIYLTGGAKDSLRNKKAFELFEKSQKAGNKIAEFMLGYAYYKGFVVAPDYALAYKYIRNAANGASQIDEAQLVLADLYTQGIGTVQNYVSAIKSYRAAINQGNIEAVLALADIYEKGDITPKNLVLAHALYNIAASHNIPDAAEKRDKLKEKMQIEELNKAQEIALNFKFSPSELTEYVRQTYGYDIRSYIDNNMTDKKK